MFVIAGIIAAYFIVTAAVNARVTELKLQTQVLIAEQEVLLATIAETTARNGADSVTEVIIKDCSIAERTRFETLLSSLDAGLDRARLVELERLFGRCGNFFAERKAVMVARLAREIEIYETFVAQLSNLSDQDQSETYQVATWRELSELELKQSDLFARLVNTQDQIINALLEGKSPSSEEVSSILQSAREIQETLFVTTQQTSDVRDRLISL